MQDTTHVDRRVALALRLADGKWCLYDEDERRLRKVAVLVVGGFAIGLVGTGLYRSSWSDTPTTEAAACDTLHEQAQAATDLLTFEKIKLQIERKGC